MALTIRKKKGRKHKKTIRKVRGKKYTFRKHRTRKAGAPGDQTREARSSRQVSMAAKQAAKLAAEEEKKRLLAEVNAEKKAERDAKKAEVMAAAAAANTDTNVRIVLQERADWAPGPATGRRSFDDPKVVWAIWYKNFEEPIREAAARAWEAATQQGFNARRVAHEVYLAVSTKYIELARENRIYGALNYQLQRILTAKYYTDRERVDASTLIRYYARLMENGKSVPQKAKDRLRGYIDIPSIWDELTPQEHEALYYIVISPEHPNEEDAHIITDEDIAIHNLLYPDYEGPILTDADLYPEFTDADLAEFERLYPDYDGPMLTDEELLPATGGRRSRSQKGGMSFDEAMNMMQQIEQQLQVVMGQGEEALAAAKADAAAAAAAGSKL